MKSFIILSLLIASVSAGCNCKPSEQACIDTCVKTANACVTQCNIHNPSKECINGCIAATWPTSITLPDQKVALNTTSSQMPIATLTPSVVSKSTGSMLPTLSPKTNLETKTSDSLTQTYSLFLLITGMVIGSFALF